MNNDFLIKKQSFQQLSLDSLYQIMALRMAVFCVEQECPYQDLDFQDQKSEHIMMFDGEKLIAYARLLESKNNCSIGRVVVEPSYRNQGVATQLMQHSITQCSQLWADKQIVISAQSYLKSFYTNLGFVSQGEFYLEDDIPHEKMIYSANSNQNI